MSYTRPYAAIVLVLLLGLSMWWLSPASAQVPSPVIHENPANLTSQQPFDVNGKLMLQLEQMFGSLDLAALNINASDFDASQLNLKDFEKYYQFFKDYLGRTSLTGSEYEQLIGQGNLTAAQLRAMINSSDAFYQEFSRFEAYYAQGDMLNATLTAVELEKQFDTMNGTSRQLTVGATVISRMLQNTSVNTNRLDQGVNTLNVFMERMDDLNKLPLSLLSNTNLTLNASQEQAGTGDNVAFTARLESDGMTVADGPVTLYVDGVPAGNATTSPDGSCVIFYEIKGGSFSGSMNAIAYFEPGGMNFNFTPAVSNNVVLERRPIATELSIQVTPEDARFGDTVLVQGRLTADGGYPVSDHLVSIFFPDQPACYATTLGDGSYSCEMYITPHVKAGELDVISEYAADTRPDEALVNATSGYARLQVLQEGTSLKLDPIPAKLTGGQDVSFTGQLWSSSGKPVPGEEIGIYADDVLICEDITTDDTGLYNARITVPLGLIAGSHRVYAAYVTEAGLSLTGSQSGGYNAEFEPVTPDIAVTGIPQYIFPGDTLHINGKASVPQGAGIGGLALTISTPNTTLGNIVTDSDGTFSFSCRIDLPAGNTPITITSEPGNLLLAASPEVGSMYVLPFDALTCAAIFAFVLLVVGLVIARITGAKRQLSRAWSRARREKKPLLKPTLKVTPLPGPSEEKADLPQAFRIEDEIDRLDAIASKGADRRDLISEIYKTSRRIAAARGLDLPDSATHREFFKRLTAREPALVSPAGTIARNYESAVFGHMPLVEQDIANSLYSLREINDRMSGEKDVGSG